MNISVFGLGYVGCVTAACLAEMGHKVIGVDVDAHKLSLIQSGRSPFYEPGLEALVRKNVTAFSLRVSGDADAAIRESELVFICVGTPSKADGSTNPRYLKKSGCANRARAQRSFRIPRPGASQHPAA